MQDAQAAEIWALEQGFWTEGPEHYRAHMHDACLMALPPPAGIMTGREILAAIEAAPRWRSVNMHGRSLARPSPGAIVVAYQAEGVREGEPPYRAICSSTYHRAGDGWRLIQHQQTPD